MKLLRILIGILVCCWSLSARSEDRIDMLRDYTERLYQLEFEYLTAAGPEKSARLDAYAELLEDFAQKKGGLKSDPVIFNLRLFLAFRRLKLAKGRGDLEAVKDCTKALESMFLSIGTEVGKSWYVDGKFSSQKLLEFIEDWDQKLLREYTGANQPVQGTPGTVPSSSTEPEARRP